MDFYPLLKLQLVVESVNNMARETQASAWNDLKGAKRRKVADVLMSNVDQVSTAVSALITPDTPRIIMKPNIGMCQISFCLFPGWNRS